MASTNQPTPKPPVVQPGAGNNIIINPLQRGNPVLDCIRNVGKEFGDIVADYQVGRTTGVLFLSLKYHRLHPEYIHTRIEKLGHSYSLRLLLVLCDIAEHRDPIREITTTCLINNITIIVAFSFEDAGHYLSTVKQFEHKPPDLIKERVDKDYNSMLRTSLTSINRVNKTDVETLKTSFGSFANIAKATSVQLQNLPGFGQVKVKNIKSAFEKPFRNQATPTLTTQSSFPGTQAAGAHGPNPQAQPNSTTEKRVPNPVASPGRDHTMDSSPEIREPAVETTRLHSIEPGTGRRNPSPTWDIELDLNDSD